METLVAIPENAGIAAHGCRERQAYFKATGIADREAWYGKHLSAIGERPLCDSVPGFDEVYRLTWLPSFHPSVVVRLERTSTSYSIIAKTESGAGGYEPGHLARDTTFALTPAEMREFSDLLSAARFWTLSTRPPPDGTAGLDGAQWVVEGLSHGRYHVVDRWSPRADGVDAQYRRLAEWMLRLSGLTAPDIVRQY